MHTFEDIKKVKKIVVYGAGGVATDVIALLTSINPQLSIDVVVTETENNVSDLLGHRVISYDMSEDVLKKNLVVIAMVEYEKVASFLAKNGIQNIITVFDLKEMLYLELYKQPIQKDVILFTYFNGKGYGGNPKYICEKIKKQYKCVWAVENEDEKVPKEVEKVIYGSYEYYKWLSKAKIWVDNDHKNVLTKKREQQYYIQTWHGSGPLKKIEHDAESLSSSYLKMSDMDVSMIDLYISPSSFTTEQARRAFKYNGEILECGYPRNDVLFSDDVKNKFSKYKGDNIWIIYAPTYRDYESNVLNAEKTVEIFEKKYGKTCKVLVREHPKMKGKVQYSFGDKIIDVTNYPDVQELLSICDVLITDYSSLMWDFSLQKKPVFLFHPDKDLFIRERGFYLDFSELPYIEILDMNSFEKTINDFQEEEYLTKLDLFFEKYISYDDGHASEKVAKIINDKMGE